MTARSWRALVLGAVVTGMLVAGCGNSLPGASLAGTGGGRAFASVSVGEPAGAPPTAMPAAGSVRCDFTSTPDQPAPPGHDVGLPPTAALRSGTVTVTLHTSQGDIPMTMPRAEAPCTIASFAFLAGKGFFDGSPCHRLTAVDSLRVLQCGDPTGTGTGGPGYTVPDENPTNLPAAPDGQADVYARGTVAMANAGQPHSGGSQFFLVYGNSELPPAYAVFGRVSAAGLAVLDKVARGGVADDDGQHDGPPAITVTIKSVTVAG
ncbi:MAG TPA: peptidylprolyl isomerase [Pseudonocardiaceae bacterium]|nr:peptidylprolyl isomerase [Pseudonocardiaceae bacterium]